MNLTEQLERLNALYVANAISADEFAKAKAKLLGDDAAANAAPSHAQTVFNDFTKAATASANKLGRSAYDRWFGGVCGGLAASTEVPAWAWRVLFVLLALLHGLGLLLYILLWIFMPLATVARVTAAAQPAPAAATQSTTPPPVPTAASTTSTPSNDTPPQN